MKKLIIIIPLLILTSLLFCFGQDEEIKVDSISPYGPDEHSESAAFEDFTIDIAPASKDRVYQLDDFRDIVWALETLLKYCPEVSTEVNKITTTDLVYRPILPLPDRLRQQAAEIEQRDKDILKAKEILKKWRDIQEALEEMYKDQIKRNSK